MSGMNLGAVPQGTEMGFGALVVAFLKQGLGYVLRAVFLIAPQFGRFSPLGDLVNGRLVRWGLLAEAGAMMVFLKPAAAMLLGIYFYYRRELARVIA